MVYSDGEDPSPTPSPRPSGPWPKTLRPEETVPMSIMRCPKCGYTQKAGPTCKSCGAPSSLTFAPGPAPSSSTASPVRSVPVTPAEVAAPIPAPQTMDAPPTTDEAVLSQGSEASTTQPFFFGSGGSLFGIHIVNAFFTLLTLGLYYFWGKVRVRKYLFSQSEFEGDRFAYHGTGKELLVGFLKAALVMGIISALFNAAPMVPGGIPAKVGMVLLAYALLITFIPLAMVGSRRYRMSRASWRGVRFSFRGEVVPFIKLFVSGALLTLLTLGFYGPIFEVRRYAFMASQSFLGDRTFGFDGRGRELFGPYVLTAFLTLPTLGLSWIWWIAKKRRYLWNHTSFGSARFRSTVTGGRLFLLYLGNLLLFVLTLGLGWSWILVRNVRFEFANLMLEGETNLDSIRQDAQAATATGEGLNSLLDLDAGFGPA